jgi:hypothetical protein
LRPDKKQERLLEKIAAYLGKDKEELPSVPVETKTSRSNEADALLDFIQNPKQYLVKNCKRCGEAFSTNYRAVAFCSDLCRAKSLEQIGIQWNPYKTATERWGGVPPLIVPPAAIRVLREMLSVPEASDTSADNIPQLDEIPEVSVFDNLLG